MMSIKNSIFQEIDELHSQWSLMDRASRMRWLTVEKMRLNGLANQLALYVRASGGFVNDAERACARELLEMIQEVDAEGSKAANELRNEAVKELVKHLICG